MQSFKQQPSTPLYTLSMSDIRINSDSLLVKDIFVLIEKMTGRTFTYDACSADSGVNSNCAAFSSPSKSFLKSDVSGQHVWMNPPFTHIEPFIKHYMKCKSAAPKPYVTGAMAKT